jgi:hypothetical protein
MSAFQARVRRQVKSLASPLVRLAPERYSFGRRAASAWAPTAASGAVRRIVAGTLTGRWPL